MVGVGGEKGIGKKAMGEALSSSREIPPGLLGFLDPNCSAVLAHLARLD